MYVRSPKIFWLVIITLVIVNTVTAENSDDALEEKQKSAKKTKKPRRPVVERRQANAPHEGASLPGLDAFENYDYSYDNGLGKHYK